MTFLDSFIWFVNGRCNKRDVLIHAILQVNFVPRFRDGNSPLAYPLALKKFGNICIVAYSSKQKYLKRQRTQKSEG